MAMISSFANGQKSGGKQAGEILEGFPINHDGICPENKAHIRPYQQTDRGAVRRLCCETGFLGEPVAPLFQDSGLFADLFTNAYLDHEPEWALVAEVDGKIIGYLLGAVSKHFDLLLLRSGFCTAAKMLIRIATGRYLA